MPTPDYISEVKPLEDAGQTDEQIAAELVLRHERDVWGTKIPGRSDTDLLHIVNSRMRVLRRDKTGFTGPLVDYFDAIDGSSPAEQQALKQGFEMLLGVLNVAGREVYCGSHGATGQLVTGITEVVKSIVLADASNPYTPAMVQAEMDNFTGGIKYPGLTAADVAQSRTDYTAQQAANARRTAAAEAMNVTIKAKCDAAMAAAKAAYQAADYTQDIDHAAAVIAAADAAYNA